MAETITPNTTPPQPPTPGNVSALVSPDIIANVKASQSPQSFGDQLARAAVAAGTNAALSSATVVMLIVILSKDSEGLQGLWQPP